MSQGVNYVGERRSCPTCPEILDDLASTLHTSGTTGRPKGVMTWSGGLARQKVAVSVSRAWDREAAEKTPQDFQTQAR